MRTVAIVQARLRSTRLPAKVLLPLPTGRTVLQEVVARCKAIPGIDDVVVASPEGPESRLIHPFIGEAYWCEGSEDDVLARYYRAAVRYKADVIVRVTSDCPMIDPILCGQVIRHRAQHGQAYSYNNMPVGDAREGTFPKGLDCEAFTFKALEYHNANSADPLAREHVTWSMRAMAQGSDQPMNPAGDYSHLRWTLDTIDDYALICGLMGAYDGATKGEAERMIERFRG